MKNDLRGSVPLRPMHGEQEMFGLDSCARGPARVRGAIRLVVVGLAAGMWLAAVMPACAQSQGSTQSQTEVQTTPPAAQSQTKQQPQPEQENDSVAEAARKAKEKKAKTEPGKVYTEEEMSGLSSRGVSVVGNGNSGGAGTSGGTYSGANSRRNAAAQSEKREEAYWRGRARQLLDQMAATDQQIDRLKEEIKKYGNGGFDPSTGLGQNVIYVVDRQSQLNRLEKKRGDLDKQMEQLQEEGRKAGASPSWLR